MLYCSLLLVLSQYLVSQFLQLGLLLLDVLLTSVDFTVNELQSLVHITTGLIVLNGQQNKIGRASCRERV